ncbi:MAG: Rho termination factor N-terminal domain-containing protein, partial [Pauljensenia sp.]
MSNESPAEMTTASLSAMKLPELKALAASRGLKGISQLRKSQLIELLSNGANASTPREATSVADKPAAQAPAPAKAPREEKQETASDASSS